MRLSTAAPCLILAAAFAIPAEAQPVRVQLIAQAGDTPALAPGPITNLGFPTANTAGQVGFTGIATSGIGFVWVDGGIVWLNTDANGYTLNPTAGVMGVSDAGGYIYSPGVDGLGAVWTHQGLLAKNLDQAPGFPAGVTLALNNHPSMLPGGAAFWVAGFIDPNGPNGRMLYTSADATPANTQVVFKSFDVIGAFTIAALGIDRNYHVSDNGLHHIQELLMDTGSTVNDGFLYVDGSLVARETEPVGDGTNWDNFDLVSINNAGHYLVSGDTSGALESDEFLAHDLQIALRQGDMVDGETLAGTVRGVSINNRDQAAWSWTTGAGEGLFFACDAAALHTSSALLLSTGDSIDIDNDGMADGSITDVNLQDSGGNGLKLTDDGAVFLPVDVNLGGGGNEAVIRLEVACCGDGHANQAAGEACDDGGDSMTCDADCTTASCGDGYHNAVAEECDDGGESAACDADCTTASCGDGTLNTSAGEQCDDGNVADDDGCSANCQQESTMTSTSSSSAVSTGAGGGASSSVGAGGSGGSGGSGGGGDTDADGSCACSAAASSRHTSLWLLIGLAGIGLARRRHARV